MIEAPTMSTPVELLGVVRSLFAMPALALRWRRLPKGNGAAVLVLPGFLADDRSTVVLRGFLAALGYAPRPWNLGKNDGNVKRLVPRVAERVRHLSDRSEQPIAIVGWSLGGVLAREACHREPGSVRRIVTLGTPVIGGPKYTAAAGHYRRKGIDLDEIEEAVERRNRRRLPAPLTAIFSRRDRVVAWQACIDPNRDNDVDYVEVDSTHFELGFSPEVMSAVARSLARW